MRAGGVLLAAAMLAPTSACVLETLVAPRQEPLVQVHAILNAGIRTQVILVEHSLSGDGEASSRGGTVAISGAAVTVTGVGRTYVAREVVDTISGTNPPQVNPLTRRYEFNTEFPIALVPGGTYSLRVETPDGVVVTGTTLIPAQSPVTAAISRSLNRDRDTLSLTWNTPLETAAFWVRAEGQGVAFDQFVSEPRVRLAGNLKGIEFDDPRTDIFLPGFIIPVNVAAVDRNLYDYFRSRSDPFTGIGRINHLIGGRGVFGSMTTLLAMRVDVTAEIPDPVIEGRWLMLGAAPSSVAAELRIYVAREISLQPIADTSTVALFGTYSRPNGARLILFGARAAQDVQLTLRGALGGGQTDETVNGFVSNDTLYAVFAATQTQATFVRRP
jgi:hypothetical protein